MDMRRHAPVARRARPGPATQHRALPQAYLGRVRSRRRDSFLGGEFGQGAKGRFRWLLSTCVAAAVGALAVGVVILGSGDPTTGEQGLLQNLQSAAEGPGAQFRQPAPRDGGLRWATPKADRLQTLTGALSARFVIHDSMRQKRGNREMIVNKSYARIVARLAPIPAKDADKIPPFNPYKLYAAPGSGEDGAAPNAEDTHEVAVKVIELLGGILPGDDGQEMDNNEVADLVARAQGGDEEGAATGFRGAFQPDGAERLAAQEMLAERSARAIPEPLPPNTTALAKNVVETDDVIEDLEAREVRVAKVARGQTLSRILLDMGGERTVVRAMVEAAKTYVADIGLVAGQEVHVTLVPSLTRANKSEPARFSVFGEGHDHKVTVARNAAGEFVASMSPLDDRIARAALGNEDQTQASSLYASLFHASIGQGLTHETINGILRIHAYESDFRRRVRGGDTMELFFDMKEEDKGVDGALGELLATTLTTGGETHKFYRFRTQDGVIDFYDEQGNTSRKFLMRRPVRGEAMRLASGFGMRRHPLINQLRMHAGIDWAGPIGTPIMAAGAGLIEEAGRKGEYGNYVRIRHANGYKTAYAHMARFASGISEGVRVRQGQVIGYIGNTGLSAGPHLHYEVLVNNQHVDPMSIQVPRERRLTGKQLAEFQKERARVDELARRNPVSSKIVEQPGPPVR
jgi:murein DD-endopeptidase MepM/ murein hydrolase activator NlpD